MSLDPMHTPGGLNWDPASVDMPEIPMLPPGEDAMSMTISGVLPTLTAPMAASVAALQARETMFAGKLGSADSAYQNADDQGGQSVGQLLGQLGQMAGQAGAPAQQLGQQAGQFGSMMQQAMQAAQGGASPGGGQPAATQSSTGQSSDGAGSVPAQHARDDAEQRDRDAREKDDSHGRPPLDSAAAGATPHGGGRAPVAPPQRGVGDDLERRM